MSVRADPQVPFARPPARTRDTAGMLALVATGSLMLLMRTRLLVLSPDARALAIAVLFGAMLIASLLVPVAPGRRRLPAGGGAGDGRRGAGACRPGVRAARPDPLQRLGAPARAPGRGRGGGAVPARRVRRARTGRRRDRDRGHVVAVRRDPPAALRGGGVPGGPGRRSAPGLAAMGLGNLDRAARPLMWWRTSWRWRFDEANARDRARRCCWWAPSPSGAPGRRRPWRSEPSTRSPGRRPSEASTNTGARSWPHELVNQDGGVDGRQIQVESVDAPGSDAASRRGRRAGGARRQDRARQLPQHDLGPRLHRGRETGPAVLGDGGGGHAAVLLRTWGRSPSACRPRARCSAAPPSGSSPIRSRPSSTAIRGPCGSRSRTSTTSTAGRFGAARSPRCMRWVCAPSGRSAMTTPPSTWRGWSRRIKATKPDVLFVSAYLADAIALRRQLVDAARAAPRQHRHLLQLLHAGVRGDARQGCRGRVRVGQAVGVLDRSRRACVRDAQDAAGTSERRCTRRNTGSG